MPKTMRKWGKPSLLGFEVIFLNIIRAILRNKWRHSYLGLQYKAQTFWIEEKMFLIFPLVN